jgi:hypothetical protein
MMHNLGLITFPIKQGGCICIPPPTSCETTTGSFEKTTNAPNTARYPLPSRTCASTKQ